MASESNDQHPSGGGGSEASVEEPKSEARYVVHLDTQAEDGMLTARKLDMVETYNTGWRGEVEFSYEVSKGHIGAGNVTAMMIGNRAVPGAAATVHLELFDAADPEAKGTGVRIWPSMMTSLTSEKNDDLRSSDCTVDVVDPLTFLSNRPVWGAYRGESAGAMLGGMLSMAAGGDGKPSLEPMVPGGIPPMKIVEDYRDDLKELPYAVAAGETLGEWTRVVLGQLGLRLELLGLADGSVQVRLSDREAGTGSTPLQMALPASEGGENAAAATDSARLSVSELSVRPIEPMRAAVVDDPTRGRIQLTALGAVGRVLTGPGIGMDEAARRGRFAKDKSSAESLVMIAASRQPLWRPGRLVELDKALLFVETWQVGRVRHRVTGNVYTNTGTLLPGNRPWRPSQPARRAPRLVSATVDAGKGVLLNEPVPRDELGRIPVKLVFVPTAIGEELLQQVAADTNMDGYVTMTDFDAEEIEDYTDNQAEWDEKAADYEADAASDVQALREKRAALDERETTFGERETALDEREAPLDEKVAELEKKHLKELHEKGSSGDLLREQKFERDALRKEQQKDRDALQKDRDALQKDRDALQKDRDALQAERDELQAEHEAARRYMAYRDAKALDDADRDRDGYLSDRDALVSDDLSAELSDAKKREKLERQWRKREADALSDVSGEREQLLDEYGALFHPESLEPEETIELPGLEEEEDASVSAEDMEEAKEDAEVESQRWPPRLPLTIVQPMAGTLHGFVTSHRHGDSCRVAVHHPMWAEIVGFQYRQGQSINAQLREAAAGMVVEHDTGVAWTGMVFRRRGQ